MKKMDLIAKNDPISKYSSLTIISHLNSNILEFSVMLYGSNVLKTYTIIPPKTPI